MFLVYIALCTLGRLFVDRSDEAPIKLDSCRPGKCSLAEIVATHTDRTADDHTDNDLVKTNKSTNYATLDTVAKVMYLIVTPTPIPCLYLDVE